MRCAHAALGGDKRALSVSCQVCPATGAAPPPESNGIILSAPPDKLADELGIGPGAHAERQIGLDKVPEQKVKELAADLETNPALAMGSNRHACAAQS